MADLKISALPLTGTLDDVDEIIVNDGGGTSAVTSKTTLQGLKNYVLGANPPIYRIFNNNRTLIPLGGLWPNTLIEYGAVDKGYIDGVYTESKNIPVPEGVVAFWVHWHSHILLTNSDNIRENPNYNKGNDFLAPLKLFTAPRMTITGGEFGSYSLVNNGVPANQWGFTTTQHQAVQIQEGTITKGMIKVSTSTNKSDIIFVTPGATSLDMEINLTIGLAGFVNCDFGPQRITLIPLTSLPSVASIEDLRNVNDGDGGFYVKSGENIEDVLGGLYPPYTEDDAIADEAPVFNQMMVKIGSVIDTNLLEEERKTVPDTLKLDTLYALETRLINLKSETVYATFKANVEALWNDTVEECGTTYPWQTTRSL